MSVPAPLPVGLTVCVSTAAVQQTQNTTSAVIIVEDAWLMP